MSKTTVLTFKGQKNVLLKTEIGNRSYFLLLRISEFAQCK